MDITRRKFLKGAAVAAGAIGLAGTGLTLKQAKAEGTDTQWDAEYDVIVVGYGAAGANAAIVAADKGASVLLTEKCEEGLEGGNTKVSGQGLQCCRMMRRHKRPFFYQSSAHQLSGHAVYF